MTPPVVSPLLGELFTIAGTRYQAENKAWVQLSYRLAGRFNLITALMSIQRQGNLDILLRCLEDEFSKTAPDPDFSLHYQMMFSETWVISCYEILRAFRERDWKAAKAGRSTSGVSELDDFKSVFADLELLRMPIAKFQIAKDDKLTHPLPMHRVGEDDTRPTEFYDPKDPDRFHIMPTGVSTRGSALWLAVDGRNSSQHWIERRDLADRLLNLRHTVKGAGELEAEQIAASQGFAEAVTTVNDVSKGKS